MKLIIKKLHPEKLITPKDIARAQELQKVWDTLTAEFDAAVPYNARRAAKAAKLKYLEVPPTERAPLDAAISRGLDKTETLRIFKTRKLARRVFLRNEVKPWRAEMLMRLVIAARTAFESVRSEEAQRFEKEIGYPLTERTPREKAYLEIERYYSTQAQFVGIRSQPIAEVLKEFGVELQSDQIAVERKA